MPARERGRSPERARSATPTKPAAVTLSPVQAAAAAAEFEAGQYVEVEKFPKTWYVATVREVDGEHVIGHLACILSTSAVEHVVRHGPQRCPAQFDQAFHLTWRLRVQIMLPARRLDHTLVQHSIYAKTNPELSVFRFNVDIAGVHIHGLSHDVIDEFNYRRLFRQLAQLPRILALLKQVVD